MLGDHLSEKSDTVKWVDVSMAHKRSCRLKDHKQLKEIAEDNPEKRISLRITLLTTSILYDFVANYDWQGRQEAY